MQEIALDGKTWNTPDDVYDAFFKAVGAPGWHGRNFNALRDSICVGQINTVEVPYLVRIKNYSLIGAGARRMAADFVQLIEDLRNEGCPVDVNVEG
jgi:RNAse (barnase) inhibitor barstar